MRLVMLVAVVLSWTATTVGAHEVYVSNEKDNTISVIDSRSMEVTRTFAVGKRPRGIAFSRDFKHFYVCASDSDAVQVYEAAGDKFLYNLPSGRDPEQFVVSRDGKRMFIDDPRYFWWMIQQRIRGPQKG